MTATTQTQASRIAQAGARKMTADKYTLKNTTIAALYGTSFIVIKHETKTRYITSIDPAKTFCTCPFFRENREFGTCKHVCRCREEAEWEAARRAEYETTGR